MLWIKAFHLIAMVAWFAGLFYLPRLFVYHADVHDAVSDARFIIMERRLYYAIMWPSGVLTTALGLWLMLDYMPYTLKQGWMHVKLSLVCGLWLYHLFCGFCMKQYQRRSNVFSSRFYRVFNEVPTVFLVVIVFLVVLKPI